MSDTRFTIIGVALIFAGFLIVGILGEDHYAASIEAEAFDDCYKYSEDRAPIKVDCKVKTQEQLVFFGIVIAIIASGVIMLLKGIRGKWDNEVKPEDMVGPSGSSKDDSKN